MRQQLSLTTGMVMLCLSSLAQAKMDNTMKLSDIQLSDAPAFNILDISPSSIQRPASTKAFTASVLSNLSNGVPQNYAMEVMPYWFIKHSKLTASKYIGIDTISFKKDSLGKQDTLYKYNAFSKLQFTSISAAVVNKDSSTNTGKLANHNLGFGIQTTVLAIYKKSDIKNIGRNSLKWMQASNIAPPGPQTSDSSHVTFEKETQPIVDSLKESLKAIPVFSIDFAAATNIAFDNNTFRSNRLNRTGVWLNFNFALPLSKKSKDDYFNLSFITRYIFAKDSLNTNKQYTKTNYFDFGAKAQFSFGKLGLAYEYIRRSSSSSSVVASYKSVGLVHYKISDGLFLTGVFGQNFGLTNNLFSALGLTWGISNGKEKVDSNKEK